VKTTVKLLIILVRHLVDDHDELWDYEKTYQNALRRMEELGQFRSFSISEEEIIDCKFCDKYFDSLDVLWLIMRNISAKMWKSQMEFI